MTILGKRVTGVVLWIAVFRLASAAAEMVPNPGFELGTDGKLAAWKLSATDAIPQQGVASTQGVLVTWADGSAGKGKRCLKMEGKGRAEGDFAIVVSPPLRLLPGFEYEVSFSYRASGLVAESGDRKNYSALVMDLFFEAPKRHIRGCRILTSTNSEGWVRLAKTFTMPSGTEWGQVRLEMVNKYPDSKVTLWWDDVSIVPSDPILPNLAPWRHAGQPNDWRPVGSAKTAWSEDVFHSGRRAVSVTDAGAGSFSGWATEIPVRSDRAYTFGGFVKGGDLNPDGPIGGGAFCLQFLDAQGQPVGQPLISPAVPAKTDWTQVATPKSQPPPEAVSARLTAGLQFCRGTAWFDDLFLTIAETQSQAGARIRRGTPRPQEGIRYSRNLARIPKVCL